MVSSSGTHEKASERPAWSYPNSTPLRDVAPWCSLMNHDLRILRDSLRLIIVLSAQSVPHRYCRYRCIKGLNRFDGGTGHVL
jgi:hypothetical protein